MTKKEDKRISWKIIFYICIFFIISRFWQRTYNFVDNIIWLWDKIILEKVLNGFKNIWRIIVSADIMYQIPSILEWSKSSKELRQKIWKILLRTVVFSSIIIICIRMYIYNSDYKNNEGGQQANIISWSK